MNFKYLVNVSLSVIYVLGLWSCHSGGAKPAEAGKKGGMPNVQGNLEGFVVKNMPLSEVITLSGTLVPAEETVLYSEVSGRVVRLSIPEGKKAEKGKLLVKLFDQDLQAQLRKLGAQLAIAENTEKRQKELLGINGVSQQEYELNALQISNIKADIDLVKVQISKTEIRAPYTGTIGLRNISEGAYLTPSMAVATIRQNTRLKLNFSIPEKYSQVIKTGQRIKFTTSGLSDVFTAQIIAAESKIETNSRNLNVRAQVADTDSRLSAGAFVEVRLALSENKNAILIPSQAIIPQARDKKVVVVRNGKAQMTTIKTGARKPQQVEVTEGLVVGDTIAVTGVMFIRPEMSLKFAKFRDN